MTKKELNLNQKINIINNEHSSINISDFFNLDNIKIIPSSNIFINKEFYNNLDIFNVNNINKSIFNSINNTYTLFGTEILYQLLHNPIYNINILQHRQSLIKNINNNFQLSNNIKNILLSIKNNENTILWFWNKNTEHIDSIHDIILFNNKYLQFFNNNIPLLQISNIYKIYISPFTTICSPIMTIIVPYIILKYLKINIPIKFIFTIIKSSLLGTNSMFLTGNLKYIYPIFSFFIYIQSIYNAVILSINVNKTINIIHKKLNSIYNIIKSYEQIQFISHKFNLSFININILSNIHQNYLNINKYFSHNIFKSNSSIFENKGQIISTYYNFNLYKNNIICLLKYIGLVDSYLSTSLLFNNNFFCFTQFTNNIKPVILFKDVKHPYLINCVANNVKLIDKNLGMIITGPNAAGKSTYIKSLTISILLSQTLGIACSKYAILSPFYNISTYLNIPDCQGKESLFEAEMFRCKEYLHFLKNNNNKLSFIVMDEILSSTNYVEGYSAAFAILNKLASYYNNITIITTHYNKLSKLDKYTNFYFNNFKFSVNFDFNDNIHFSYKIKKGISKQYIALKLLQNNFFDPDIINLSQTIVNKIKYKY
jgi:DNA mismatch repair protein MutS